MPSYTPAHYPGITDQGHPELFTVDSRAPRGTGAWGVSMGSVGGVVNAGGANESPGGIYDASTGGADAIGAGWE
jgi:hypothetical protein